MSEDPRRVLEDAAQRRASCEILPRGGGIVRGTIVRVEKGGVVVTTAERRFAGGEDVRIWFTVEGGARSFEASVIRSGVPVPDRSQDGLMLGFIDKWASGEAAGGAAGRVLDLLPPNGQPVSLFSPETHLLHVAIDGISFTTPATVKLVFVESGTVQVRLGIPSRPPVVAGARVRSLASDEGWLLYDLQFEDVDDPDALRIAVDGLASTIR